MRDERYVLVIGAGIGGLTAATLRQSVFQPRILEAGDS